MKMLDEKVKHAYQKITPSSELEKKICAMQGSLKVHRTGVLSMKSVLTLAASVVLLLGSFATVRYMARSLTPNILLPDGTEVTQDEVRITPDASDISSLAMIPRMAAESPVEETLSPSEVSFTFEISSRKAVSLEAEEGTLFIVNETDGAVSRTEIGKSLRCQDETVAVCWSLPKVDENRTYRMTVGNDVILITYHAMSDEYFMVRYRADHLK